jgi:hypothetical protein
MRANWWKSWALENTCAVFYKTLQSMVISTGIDGRWQIGVAVRGYYPVAPRPFKVRAHCAPPLVPPVISRGASRQATWETSVSEGRNWARNDRVNLAYDSDFHVNRRVILHAANLRHGTDGFTSPPKEGMLWLFLKKNPTASARFEPAFINRHNCAV